MFSTDVKVDIYPVVEQMKTEELLRVLFTVNAHKENGTTVLHKHIEGEDQYGNEKDVSVTLKTLMYAYLCNEFSPREDCDTAVIEVTLTLPGGYNYDDSGDYQAERRTASVSYWSGVGLVRIG